MRRVSPALAVTLGVLLAACASRKKVVEPGGATAAGDITVSITNDLTPPHEVTASVESSRLNRLLGDVPPQQTRSFTFKGPLPADYQFVVKGALMRAMRSPLTNLTPEFHEASWQLRTNTLLVLEP